MTVPVEEVARELEAEVGVKVETEPGRKLIAPRPGVMTTSALVPGVALTNGQVAFTLDDAPVIAMVADAPLYRSLAPGDKGSDVARLQHWLAGLGHAVAGDGAYGQATARAVSALQAHYGLAGPTGVFDIGWVVWIGSGDFVPATITQRPGDPVGNGSSVAEAAPVASRVSVTELADFPAGTEATLVVGAASVPYAAGSGAVDDPEDAAAVSAALAGETESGGVIRSTESTRVLALPTGAVITDAEGRTCVFPDAEAQPVEVTPVGSGVGTQFVLPVAGVSTVLVNPVAALASPSCG